MKLMKVFYGTTKDGKDRILYKTYEKCNNHYKKYYVDLKTKEKYSEDYVSNLIPYNSRSNRKRMTRRKVLKTYKVDTRLLFHTDNLFVGDIYKVEWKKDNFSMSASIQNGNKVFVKLNDDEYKELVTNKVYKKLGSHDLYMDDVCVTNLRNIENVLKLEYKIVSKDKVLRKKYLTFNK